MSFAVLKALAFAVVVITGYVGVPTQSQERDSKSRCLVQTTTTVAAFIRAFNARDVQRLDELWAQEPSFQWYSTTAPGARLGAKARDRSTLLQYFRNRMRRREHLRLLGIRVGVDQARALGNFNGKLVRSGNDLRPITYGYKGAVSCLSQARLIVWSMSRIGARA